MLQAINSFIPIQTGQSQFIATQGNLLNNLLGQIGYEVENGSVVFTEDITALGINNVMMKLVVMDLSKFSDYDILPIGADMEAIIVQNLFKLFSAQMPTDKINDPGVDQAATAGVKP